MITMSLLAASDSGVVGDFITNINQPAFSGVAEPNTIVRVFANDELVGQGVVGSDDTNGVLDDGLGLWEVTVEPLVEGEYTITVTIEDLAGNITEAEDAVSIEGLVIDTLAPQRPTIDLINADDTGSSDLDGVTIGDPTQGDGIVDVRVTSDPDTTVDIKDGNTVIATVAVGATGETVVTLDFVTLAGTTGFPAEGPHPLSAEAYDQAENRSDQSEELLLHIDFTAPTDPVGFALETASDTGYSATDNVTSQTMPVYAGTAEANATIRIFANGELVGEGLVLSDESDGISTDGLGLFEVTLSPLADGTYDLTVEVEDLAGNIVSYDPSLNEGTTVDLEVDTAGPNTPFLDLLSSSDSGRSDVDNITYDNTPTLSATTEDPHASTHIIDENLWFRIYDRPQGGAEVLVYDSLATLGDLTDLTQVEATLATLPDGIHDLKLEVEDRAGNISYDYLLDVVIDTAAPTLTLLLHRTVTRESPASRTPSPTWLPATRRRRSTATRKPMPLWMSLRTARRLPRRPRRPMVSG